MVRFDGPASEPVADAARGRSDYCRLPGLFRLRDLREVLSRDQDYRVQYVQLTERGTPLFAVFRRPLPAPKDEA